MAGETGRPGSRGPLGPKVSEAGKRLLIGLHKKNNQGRGTNYLSLPIGPEMAGRNIAICGCLVFQQSCLPCTCSLPEERQILLRQVLTVKCRLPGNDNFRSYHFSRSNAEWVLCILQSHGTIHRWPRLLHLQCYDQQGTLKNPHPKRKE